MTTETNAADSKVAAIHKSIARNFCRLADHVEHTGEVLGMASALDAILREAGYVSLMNPGNDMLGWVADHFGWHDEDGLHLAHEWLEDGAYGDGTSPVEAAATLRAIAEEGASQCA